MNQAHVTIRKKIGQKFQPRTKNTLQVPALYVINILKLCLHCVKNMALRRR